MTAAEIVEKWRPALYKMVRVVCRNFRVTTQEKRDLFDTAPAVLAAAVMTEQITETTPANLAATILYRGMVSGIRGGVGGIKQWRPDVRYVRKGTRCAVFLRRFHPTFTDQYGAAAYRDTASLDSFVSSLRDCGETPDEIAAAMGTDEIFEKAAKLAGLSKSERHALRTAMDGVWGYCRRGAAERGCSTNAIHEALMRARRKCIAAGVAEKLLY